MKYNLLHIYFLFLFIPMALSLSSLAQDTPPIYKIDSTVFDPETKTATFITHRIEAGVNEQGDTLSIYFQKIRTGETKLVYTHYLCLFTDQDLGCSGTGDNLVRIKLENGETIKLDKDVAEIKCQPPVESMFLMEETVYEKLRTNNIVSVRLKQSKYYSDFTIRYPDLMKKAAFVLAKYI
jgi:hypothetical protein